MGNEKISRVVLDLDDKDFLKKISADMGFIADLGMKGTESMSQIASTLGSIGTIAGVVGVALLAIKTALDLQMEAERIQQINNQFDAMAKSAGLAGSAIKTEILAATKGLADDTDVLEAANKAFISMEGNAKHLGETMEMARKITALFGGDLVQNFESLNQALASGNARALKQYGLIIDQDKAYREYAKSLGIGVKYLDDAGKKQAILNAALEQGKKKFADVDETTLQTTGNVKKMGVELANLGEVAVMAWNKIAGPSVNKATSGLADAFHTLATRVKAVFAEGEEKQAAAKEALEITIRNTKEQLEQLHKTGLAAFNPGQVQSYEQVLKQASAELDKMNEAEEKKGMLEMKNQQAKDQFGDGKKEGGSGGEGGSGVDYEKLKNDRKKFEKDLEDIRRARVDSEIQFTADEETVASAFAERKISMEKEAQLQIDQVKQEARDLGLINNQDTLRAIEDINTNLKMKLMDNERELQDARINALNNYQMRAMTAADGISAAFKKGATQAKQDLTNWGKTGGMVFDTVKTRSVAAFKAMGDGSKDAGAAMRGFLFGSIGDTAVAKGTEMLLSGIWPPNPIAIAGGGALIAFGSMLQSQAEGGSKLSGGGGGGGGGAAASSSGGDDLVEKPEAKAQEKKMVSVNIHGNLYETDQTRTRLMEMIRESGDFTDFDIKKAGN